MTVADLREKLIQEHAPKWAYWLYGGHPAASHPGGEACCIDKVLNEWQTYYSERGAKKSHKKYPFGKVWDSSV